MVFIDHSLRGERMQFFVLICFISVYSLRAERMHSLRAERTVFIDHSLRAERMGFIGHSLRAEGMGFIGHSLRGERMSFWSHFWGQFWGRVILFFNCHLNNWQPNHIKEHDGAKHTNY